jgi:hypothetical protein
MPPVVLGSMTPTQEEGWRALLDLYQGFQSGWCLIGGQMVWLLAIEHGVDPIRLTDDVDVAVDIRADQGAIRRAAATTIPDRENPDRDWNDAAFLLTLVADPIDAAAHLTKGQKRGLRTIKALLDAHHPAWRQLGERARLGRATLEFLLEE